MVISIEKEISEMHGDIDRVIRLFFPLKYDLLYRLGLDGISACFVLHFEGPRTVSYSICRNFDSLRLG